MTAPLRLEQDLPMLLDDLYVTGTPDYRDDLVGRIARTPQRPAWTFPERWLPMDLATQRVPTPRLPWRQLAVLALIAALTATALAMYVGSRPRLPDPFGPAANGVVSYESGGAIHLFDPATGMTTTLASDADGWIDPWFSPDGRTMLLAREIGADEVEFGVLPLDGGEIRVVTPDPLMNADWLEWSPASDALILVSTVTSDTGNLRSLEPAVTIIDVDRGAVRTLDTEPTPTYATFIPPTGERVLVVTQTPTYSGRVIGMLPDGSDPDLILETAAGHRIVGRPAISPDGRQMAYAVWDPADGRVSLHLFDMQTGEDRRLADDPSVDLTAAPRFSPDGSTLVVERKEGPSGRSPDVHVAFIDVPTGTVTTTDLVLPNGGALEWSPDGRSVVASVRAYDGAMAPHVLIDPVTGQTTPAPWTAVSYPSWQRKAP